ncbi:MAG: AbrB/MazE/SpoVT family DNA-binding domain-containing protein [Candidatus Nanoarchaeia archaeon]
MAIQIQLSKMSSKGQIVIPKSMRSQFREGEGVIFIQEGDRVILKPLQSLNAYLREEIELSHRIEEAYARYDKGEFISKNKEEFLEEIKKW